MAWALSSRTNSYKIQGKACETCENPETVYIGNNNLLASLESFVKGLVSNDLVRAVTPPPEVRFHFLELRQSAPFSVLVSTNDTKVLRGVTRRSQQTKNRKSETATKCQPVQNCTLATLVAQ